MTEKSNPWIAVNCAAIAFKNRANQLLGQTERFRCFLKDVDIEQVRMIAQAVQCTLEQEITNKPVKTVKEDALTQVKAVAAYFAIAKEKKLGNIFNDLIPQVLIDTPEAREILREHVPEIF